MSYKYEDEKPGIFTDDGVRTFLKIRDRVKYLLSEAGAFTTQQAICKATGSNWLHLACLDYMVEIGELRKVSTDGWTQGHVFSTAPIRD